MTISILIPYRASDEYRTKNLKTVTNRWCAHMERHHHGIGWAERYEIVIGRDESEPFNRSAARNDAFNKSKGSVLIIADADTVFVDDDAIDYAIESIYRWKESWVIPYGTYYNATKAWTDRYHSVKFGVPVPEMSYQYLHRLENTICGIIVMWRGVFEEVGGYDERFTGWGYEDDAFGYAVEALYGPYRRLHAYSVIHLWHPHSPETNFKQPFIEHNELLVKEYEWAAQHGTMRELLGSRHAV